MCPKATVLAMVTAPAIAVQRPCVLLSIESRLFSSGAELRSSWPPVRIVLFSLW